MTGTYRLDKLGHLVCLLVLASLIISPLTFAQPGIVVKMDASTHSNLRSQIDRAGSTRVIVGLDEEREVDVSSRSASRKMAPRADHARRMAIAGFQDRLLSRVFDWRARAVKRFKRIPYLALEVDDATLENLMNLADVVSIQEDRLLHPTLNASIPLIGASFAHADGFTGAGQAIAVLDTGVDGNHAFLSGKILPGVEACFSTTYGSNISSLCPDGSDAQVGPGAGANCSGISGCDHGTHVAGIAVGDGPSFSGVAPDANLIPIQVFSRFDDAAQCSPYAAPCISAYSSDLIAALEHVYDLAATYSIAAVNMSLGGGSFTSSIECDTVMISIKEAIDNLRAIGIPTVIAAGNAGSSTTISLPGCISSAISVGATTDADAIASYSNSASWLSVLAPGSSIQS